MIYIVTWILVEIFTVPCEINKPHYDEYGRWVNQGVICAVHCTDTREEQRAKTFCSRSKAEDFIKNAPQYEGFGMSGGCKNMMLDSCDAWLGNCTAGTE